MIRVGVVRSYQLNESDMMTYQDASNENVQFYAVGTREIKQGSLLPFVHEHSEAGYQSILDEGFDIIDVPDPMYDWACWLAERHPRVVVTVWENLWWRMVGQHWRQMLEGASLIVARSRLSWESMVFVHGDLKEARYIPAAVDREMFTPGKKHPHRVIYMGRLCWEKGLSDLMAAALTSSWDTHIYGEGDAREWMEKLLDQVTTVEPTVHIHGYVPHAETPTVYANANVLVYPSWPTFEWQEQFGISCIEAAAAGCKLVLSHQSAFEEFAKVLRNVYLFAPGDFMGLRQAVNQALASEYKQEYDVFPFDSMLIGQRLREAYRGLLG